MTPFFLDYGGLLCRLAGKFSKKVIWHIIKSYLAYMIWHMIFNFGKLLRKKIIFKSTKKVRFLRISIKA